MEGNYDNDEDSEFQSRTGTGGERTRRIEKKTRWTRMVTIMWTRMITMIKVRRERSRLR